MKNTPKIAVVYWRDICSVTHERHMWQTLEEALEGGESCYNREHTTAGEILVNNKKYVIIAGTSAPESNGSIMYSDISMIPQTDVLRIKYVK